MDNIEVAVLTKINELAQRFGVKPYEFIATLSDDLQDIDGCRLTFVVPAETSEEQRVKVEQMLKTLDANDKGILKGGEIALIDKLDAALQRVPKIRSR